jgi:putative serine protease PepD
MRFPRHLWSGDWRSESEAARAARTRTGDMARPGAPAPGEPAAHGPAAPAPARGPRWRRDPRLILAAAAALVVLAVAFVAGDLVNGGPGPAGDDGLKPLPAIAGKPIKPPKGESRATAIYVRASPAVVSLRTSAGSGTGFLIDTDGTLVTNAHVVGSAAEVSVRFGSRGRSLVGKVLGSDPSSDLAVVRIDTADVPRGAKPLGLADSRTVRVGDQVIAIGNPFGLDRTETEGIVSAVGREIQAPNGFQIDGAIQTDAAINPGNSGGPLLNDAGRVIGVNSQIETNGAQGNVGVGFAVPSNSVRQVVPRLERGQHIARPWLGVATTAPLSGTGAEVQSVVGGSPADRAGIQAGDLIREIGGQAVSDPSDVGRVVNSARPGDEIVLRVDRGGQEESIHVKLGDRPARVP